MALLETLRAGRDFTDTDRAIAEYVLAHPNDVARLKITELAERTHTSTAAVTRLRKRVGSPSYKDFLIAITEEVERTRIVSGVNPNLSVRKGESVLNLMGEVANITKKAVDSCMTTIEPRDLHGAARLVARSDRVVMFAGGDSALNCDLFANDLAKIGIVGIRAGGRNPAWATLRLARKGDVVLFVSYSGNQIEKHRDKLVELSTLGISTILVTSRGLDAFEARQFSSVVRLPTGECIMDSLGTFFSQACIRYALSCIYATAYALNLEAHAAHHRDVIKQDWDK